MRLVCFSIAEGTDLFDSCGVSLEEMKTAAVTIPVEDRIHLAAFLLHLNRRDTSEHRQALSAADRRIDAGTK